TKEDVAYRFRASDFGFSDVDGDAFTAVRISSLPGDGRLTKNGAAVAAGQLISVADIQAGKLKFTPGPDDNGRNYASFTFQVKDDGNTLNGGVDIDPTPDRFIINVTAVADVI